MKLVRKIFLISVLCETCIAAMLIGASPLTEAEAMAIVQAREEAKEAAKDAKEAQLRGASIRGTAVADLGRSKVVLNRVDLPQEAEAPESREEQAADSPEAAFFTPQTKERLSFTLSGTVRDGISELWWFYEGHRFEVFTNANFLYLSGIGEFEDEDTVCSVFSLIAEGSPDAPVPEGEWRPAREDFTEGGLQYFVTRSSGDEAVDEEAFTLIDLMLAKYGEDYDRLKIAYGNSLKLRDARAAYLKANPPKERDTVINFAPIDKAARNASAK